MLYLGAHSGPIAVDEAPWPLKRDRVMALSDRWGQCRSKTCPRLGPNSRQDAKWPFGTAFAPFWRHLSERWKSDRCD